MEERERKRLYSGKRIRERDYTLGREGDCTRGVEGDYTLESEGKREVYSIFSP